MAFGWTNPYWAGISVMVVTLPYMGAALEKALMRVIGTIIAGILAYLIAGAFAQEQAAYIACVSIILVICGYYGSGTYYPYAFTLCALTLMIVVTNTYENPAMLWTDVFFRISEISLGVFVALTVNAIFWPQNAGRTLCAKLATELDACRRLLQQSVNHYMRDEPFGEDPDSLEKTITSNLASLRPLLLQAQKDSSLVSHHRANFQHIFSALENLFITLTILRHAAESRYPRSYRLEFIGEVQALAENLDQSLAALITSFRTGTTPSNTSTSVRETALKLDDKINAIRDAGINLNYSIEDTTQFYSIVANLMDFSRGLEELESVLAEINGTPRPQHTPQPKAATSPTDSQRRFHLSHPDRIRLIHGVKVSIACISSIYAWLWLQWPGGAQAVITCTLVMQATLVASNQKAVLRLGGCLLGGTFGALSLIFLEPHFSSYLAFSIPLFLAILFFGWINFGNPSYSYAGFQAYIAFLLMTSISNTQNISLIDGVHRFMGILLGVAIAMVVQRLIWPIIPERELKRSFSEFFTHAGHFLRAYTPRRLQDEDSTEQLERLNHEVNPNAASAENWLSQIALSKDKEHQRNEMRRFALAAQTVSYRLRALEQAFQGETPAALRERLAPEILAVSEACSQVFLQIADAFREGRSPSPINPALDQAVTNMTRTITLVFRKEQAGRPYPGQQVAVLLRLARRYRALAAETNACYKLATKLDFRILDRSPFF